MIDRIVTTIYNTKTYLYCFANCISKKKKKKKSLFISFISAILLTVCSNTMLVFNDENLDTGIYLPCESMVITFRQTYSSIRNLTLLNINVTYVIFSTIRPTSCCNWSMVIGRPIMFVRHVCNVYMLFETCAQHRIFDTFTC